MWMFKLSYLEADDGLLASLPRRGKDSVEQLTVLVVVCVL